MYERSEFIENYRRAVQLVFFAWGWLVHDQTFLADPAPNQSWRGNETRLGKMIHSLRLFEQDDLRLSARHFVASLSPDKRPHDPRTTRFL